MPVRNRVTISAPTVSVAVYRHARYTVPAFTYTASNFPASTDRVSSTSNVSACRAVSVLYRVPLISAGTVMQSAVSGRIPCPSPRFKPGTKLSGSL